MRISILESADIASFIHERRETGGEGKGESHYEESWTSFGGFDFPSDGFPLLLLMQSSSMTREITVHELEAKRNAETPFVLLDVREPEEVAIVQISRLLHIPMGEIPGRLHELDPEKETIVYCHHGVRSLHVANFLLQRDFESVSSLAGGIDA